MSTGDRYCSVCNGFHQSVTGACRPTIGSVTFGPQQANATVPLDGLKFTGSSALAADCAALRERLRAMFEALRSINVCDARPRPGDGGACDLEGGLCGECADKMVALFDMAQEASK